MMFFQISFDGFDGKLEAFEKFAGERFFVERGAHVSNGGGFAFAGEQVEAPGGGAAGFTLAKNVSETARRGLFGRIFWSSPNLLTLAA
jgi:hypothetical protein